MHLKLVILIFVQLNSGSFGYYWRDYHGRIPLDAYEAGTDINQEKVYIGQAFVKFVNASDSGIYPTAIQRGKDVFVQIYGVVKANDFVQILCGQDPESFHSIPSNSTHFHLLNTNNQIVRGGIEDNKWVNIGRVKYQGGTAIGKLLSGFIGGARMYFVHNGHEQSSDSYEVLTYNDARSLIDVRHTI